MKNALTVDLEDWYQTELLQIAPAEWDEMEDRVEVGTELILELLDQHGVKATFFVVGHIARRHPGLVRKIADLGHEIGCHGDRHRTVYRLQPNEFRLDLRAARQSIEDTVGRPVNSFRAPSWSISRRSLWALEILADEGFTCDSSVQPFWTPLSGIHGAPATPYRPLVNGREIPLLEFPPTTVGLGPWRLPFAGGFYIRAVPFWLSCLALQHVNGSGPGMVYLHPWELDPKQVQLCASRKSCPLRHLHCWNLNTVESRLGQLLGRFDFAPLQEVVSGQSYPALPV